MSENGSTTMMIVVLSMISVSSICSSMSSGLFIGANEDWFTGSLFDWMDWDGYKDFKGWFGFKSDPPAANTATNNQTITTTGNVTSNTDTVGETVDTSKYAENCVYAYSGENAASGYYGKMCVTKNDPNKFWNDAGLRKLKSLRSGAETRVSLHSYLPGTGGGQGDVQDNGLGDYGVQAHQHPDGREAKVSPELGDRVEHFI